VEIDRVLREIPLFKDFSAAQVERLADLGQIVPLPAGDVVCHEGESSDSMYVVLDGRVSVRRLDAAGNQVEIRQVEAGDYFGEVALLDSKPRTATASCVTDCELFILEQSAFRDVVTADPSRVFGVLGAVADRVRGQIEERYEAELANLALEAQAEHDRHRSLAQMVAGVAHELNTPLGITNTAVDMVANRLRRDDVGALFGTDDQTQQLLGSMREAIVLAQRSLTRAQDLIHDFKKISVSQLLDDPQHDDVVDVVTSTVELFQVTARQAGLEIEVENRLPTTNREWFGYPAQLSQVLLNLLTNIERYAYDPQTGGRVDIVVFDGRTPAGPAFTITVSDHGRGIAEEDIERVFEPFFTTGRSKGGTGLGLSIVRNLVSTALKGEITLASKPGQGTTFEITFPQEVTNVQH
jgi:signal transduction histidine kinase